MRIHHSRLNDLLFVWKLNPSDFDTLSRLATTFITPIWEAMSNSHGYLKPLDCYHTVSWIFKASAFGTNGSGNYCDCCSRRCHYCSQCSSTSIKPLLSSSSLFQNSILYFQVQIACYGIASNRMQWYIVTYNLVMPREQQKWHWTMSIDRFDRLNS